MQDEEPLSLLTYVDPVLLDLERLRNVVDNEGEKLELGNGQAIVGTTDS